MDQLEKPSLEAGWLVFHEAWYPARSARVLVAPDFKSGFHHHSFRFEYLGFIESERNGEARGGDSPLKIQLAEILYAYHKHPRNNVASVFSTDLHRARWLVMYDCIDNEPVAFAKLIRYEGGLQLSLWADNPIATDPIEKLVDAAMGLARDFGFDSLYVGQGTGDVPSFMTKWVNFEWWTGKEWSSDGAAYARLEPLEIPNVDFDADAMDEEA